MVYEEYKKSLFDMMVNYAKKHTEEESEIAEK